MASAAESVTAHVVVQQKKWEEYLSKHNVEKIYRDMTAEMISSQPEVPVKFMFEYIKKEFAAELGLEAAAPAAAEEELDDYDDEDDEDDYTDFVPVKQVDKNKKRGSVVAERVVVDESWMPPVHEKDPTKTKFLADILPKIFFLAGLTRREIAVLVTAMKPIEFDPGAAIITQGEEGDMFYVVEDGICDIEVSGVGKVMEIPCPSKENPDILRRYFGELALLYDAPRAATVKARDHVLTWGLDRLTFKSILQDTASKQRLLYGNFLKQVPLFQNIGDTDVEKQKFINILCDSLKAADYPQNTVVIQEGAPGNDFFIIESGEAACTQRVGDQDVQVCPTLTSGSFFGELALLKDEPRAATVTALTPLSVVKIDRATFKRMIGNLGEIKKEYKAPEA